MQFNVDDAAVLQKRVASERTPLVRDRNRAVLRAGEGSDGKAQSREQIAKAVGRRRQFVDPWVGRYRKQALAGLDVRYAKGNPPSLTPAEQEAFKQRMLAGPTTSGSALWKMKGSSRRRTLSTPGQHRRGAPTGRRAAKLPGERPTFFTKVGLGFPVRCQCDPS